MIWEEKCFPNSGEAKSECILLANRLVNGLHLNIRPYNDVREIEIAHLVEMHCKLLGLSFEEFGPSSIPWKPIDDIVLSLRQRFGSGFDHIDSMLVSAREPSHMICLLEIFDAIFHYYRNRGKTFTQALPQDQTILTNSVKSNSPFGSRTELNLDIKVLQNDTGNEEVKVEQWKENSRQHFIEVHIPKSLPLGNAENAETSQSSYETILDNTNPGLQRPPDLDTSRTRSKLSFQKSKALKSYLNNPNREETKNVEKPSQFEKFLPTGKLEVRTHRTKRKPENSEEKETPTESIFTNQRIEKMQQWSEVAPDAIEIPKSTEVEDGDESLRQLKHVHDEIQNHIRTQLLAMETEMVTLKSRIFKSPRSKNVHFDYFGKRIQEKFPYYPKGIIWPKCHHSSMQSRNSGESNRYIPKEEDYVDFCKILTKFSNVFGSNISLETQESKPKQKDHTFCGEILKGILARYPGCEPTSDQLEHLNQKCEEYMKLLDSEIVDEDLITLRIQDEMENFIKQKQPASLLDTRSGIVPQKSQRKKSEKSSPSSFRFNCRDQGKGEKRGGRKNSKEKNRKKSTTKFDTREAQKLFLDVDVHLLRLEQEYTTLMNDFQKEYDELKNATDTRKHQKLEQLWKDYRFRIKAVIELCVNKVVERIGHIYSI